ncbi:MAG: hypothetical protein AAFU41_14230 [Pseudomonadota bacterium]
MHAKDVAISAFIAHTLLGCGQMAADQATSEASILTGFSSYFLEPAPQTYTAGYALYAAVWPLQETYPGPRHQSGLISAWLSAVDTDDVSRPANYYSTIEGGLGWWRGTRFATALPKFTVGAVSNDFLEWANGPGSGGGSADGVDQRDWATPQGKHGVAQLSNRLLWAPDGLVLNENSRGNFLGYGYTPLPFIDPQSTSRGADVSTGDNAWTVFFDTANFKGPAAFIIPNFFSKPAVGDPTLEGLFLDELMSDPWSVSSLGIETHVIPAMIETGPDGVAYARIVPTQFPANGANTSRLYRDVQVFDSSAMSDAVAEWFDGGRPAPTRFRAGGTHRLTPLAESEPGFMIIPDDGAEGNDVFIDFSMIAEETVSDGTFAYRWVSDLVVQDGSVVRLPEFYRQETSDDGEPVWTPIPAQDVPVETGLTVAELEFQPRNDNTPLTTPYDGDPLWTTPGFAAGPFEVALSDGSTLTYAWYRFIDQPAIRYWGFPDDTLARLQNRIELVHQNWDLADRYLSGPPDDQLAQFDPAQILTPPEGLEIGYVPIALDQRKTR